MLLEKTKSNLLMVIRQKNFFKVKKKRTKKGSMYKKNVLGEKI